MEKEFLLSRKLNHQSIPDISKPFPVHIFWFQNLYHRTDSPAIVHLSHKHTFFEIHFPTAGWVDYQVEQQPICHLSEGTFLLISPELSHAQADCSENYAKFSLGFAIECLENDNEASAVFSALSSPCYQTGKITENMQLLFSQALSCCSHPDTFTPYRLQGIVFSLLCEVFSQLQNPPHSVKKGETVIPQENRLLRAEQFIEDNLHLPLTVADVACYLHISSKQLNRIFQKQEDCTVLQYIHQRKINRAEQLLLQKEYSLRQISELLGFSNEYYFNLFFKKHSGMTPGKFQHTAN